jgi:hypothetical protein
MKEYPDYFPEFMQDFHDQKELFKAFYTWRSMMDKRSNSNLAQMANFRELQCLFASMLDFLFMHGWQLYRTRKSGEYADIDKSVSSLNDLERAWWSLLENENGLRMKDEYIKEFVQPWLGWLPYMPEEVQKAWEDFNKDKAQ